jgi:hypothetical protein
VEEGRELEEILFFRGDGRVNTDLSLSEARKHIGSGNTKYSHC